MGCKTVGIDIRGKKLHVKCNGTEETIDISKNNCQIIQQGKNPPKGIVVRCDES